jgi:hypothetical protein
VTSEQWARVKAHFNEGVVVAPESRSEWLAALGEPDEDVRREVAALIAAHDASAGFLEQPIEVDPRDLVGAFGEDVAGVSVRTSLAPGTRVGDYEIRREIGRGGMGIVYLAHDVHLFRPAALKSVPTVVAGDGVVLQRLRREAQAAAAVSHPGIALVYALIETSHGHFIASEYIPGRTLRDELAGRSLEPARAVRIAIDIVDALRAAHDAGVIHRDLKPENVLLTPGGTVKVIDFGIARLDRVDVTVLTMSGGVQGTPGYMAPEVFVSGGAVDARADIYAVGVMLAEMLLGRHPMEQGLAGIPPLLMPIVRRCLESDRERRYGSARDLLFDLKRLSATMQADSSAEADVRPETVSSDVRWWWQFHQGTAAVVYWMLAVPVWYAREIIGGTAARSLFFLALGALLVASILRLHLWFTSRTNQTEFFRLRGRQQTLVLAGDLLFAAALVASGVLVGDALISLAVLLVAAGVGAAVVAVFVEPSTARSAFPDTPS